MSLFPKFQISTTPAKPAKFAKQQINPTSSLATLATLAGGGVSPAKNIHNTQHSYDPCNASNIVCTESKLESTYHGFTLTELEAEAAGDWREIQNDPGQLEAFAHALRTTHMRQRGERPEHYTKAAECAVCGPVWLWEGAPDKVQGCPWCLNSGPVPRPGPVLCRDCRHWEPDTINPPGGLGQCGNNVPGLAWPWRELVCSQYRVSSSPSIA